MKDYERMKRIDELESLIQRARCCYWEYGISKWTDAEYDAMVEELRTLKGSEDVIGAPVVASFGKVQHGRRPMLSMQKAYSFDAVLDWWRHTCTEPLLVMPKYDGIALRKYWNGRIATRGDGKTGEDVTDRASVFMGDAETGDGEAVLPLDRFDAVKGIYKTPRSAVSGLLGGKGAYYGLKLLEFVPYSKFCITVEKVSLESLKAAAEKVRQMASRYPLDGVVFRVADYALFEELGRTARHWNGQIALKFANESAESMIEGIETTAKGARVAVFSPVTLGGVNVRRARITQEQAEGIETGDRCLVELAGGSVPYLVRTWHAPLEARQMALF